MVSDSPSSLVFPMEFKAVTINYSRRLEEGSYRLLAVEGAEPLHCYSELPSFGSMNDDHKKAQKSFELTDICGNKQMHCLSICEYRC